SASTRGPARPPGGYGHAPSASGGRALARCRSPPARQRRRPAGDRSPRRAARTWRSRATPRSGPRCTPGRRNARPAPDDPRPRLVGAALTVLQARRTQAAASLRRRRVALLRVPVAHDPAAVAARRETRGAGRVPVPLGAETLVRRAVLQPARRADAHVLVTRR